MAADPKARIRQQLARWRDDLINLSRLNRLLYFRHTKTSTMELEAPSADRILAELENPSMRGWRFYLPPRIEEGQPEPRRDVAPDELLTSKADEVAVMTALRSLERRASQEFMDKGLWILYLGVGMLEWTDPADDERANSPLLLVPVTIQRQNPREPFRLRRTEDDPVVNPALAVKLASEFGIDVPMSEDIEGLQVGELLERFSSLVSSRTTWRVTSRVVLSTFSFHKEVMYRDLLNNEEQIAEHSVVQSIALGTEAEVDLDFDPVPEERLDEEAPPELMVSIRDADASQRQCIVAARSGKSFVMDGPPGTGKSQTIANIIAELLANDKTVLFVSEKAAALEVVQARLESAGLGEHVLGLHSHKATRKGVAQELGRALNFHPSPPRPLAATQLSRLTERRRELTAYAAALNETRQPLGRSLHQALGRVEHFSAVPQAPAPRFDSKQDYESLSAARYSELIDVASALGRAWGPVARGAEFLWRDLVNTEFNAGRVNSLSRLIDDAASAFAEMERVTESVCSELRLPWQRSPDVTRRALQLLDLVAERPECVTGAWLTAEFVEPVGQRLEQLRDQAATHATGVDELQKKAGSLWPRLNPAGFSSLNAAFAGLKTLEVAWKPDENETAASVRNVGEFLEASERELGELDDEASRVASAFGLPRVDLHINRARKLAELGLLAGEPVHPEADWLDPTVVKAVRSARDALKVLVEDYRSKREELAEVFNESILAVTDLRDICVRFETVHKGFGRLGKQYREDKRVVARCSRSGKARSATRAHLRAALAWQESTTKLAEAATTHSKTLGDHYYRHEATDFAALTRALEVAERALDLAGKHLDLEAMRGQLALGSEANPELVATARSLADRLNAWIGRATELLGSTTTATLEGRPILQTASWCTAAAQFARATVDVLSEGTLALDTEINLGQAEDYLRVRNDVALIEEEFAKTVGPDATLLGSGYAGLETDWAALGNGISWATALRRAAGGPLPSRAASAVVVSEVGPESIRSALSLWDKNRRRVSELFLEPRSNEVDRDLDSSFLDGTELLRDFAQTTSDIHEWASFSDARNRLNEEGFEPTTSFCIERVVNSGEVAGVIERSLLESWIDAVLHSDARLRNVRRKDRDALVEEFRELDTQQIQAAASRVIEACNARRPRTFAGAAGVIRREAEKKKRHMPIRKLMAEAGSVAQALKPCFMMSPLTVSQFLPPDLPFDAVIFDEASQVTPADAVNCIYRGHQLIVAGDQKQLPPTSFFERMAADEGDEYEEEQFDEFESILDLCKGAGGLRSQPLKWHYRSQHEALITFSNYSFYKGALITFPSAIEAAPDVGVELFKVPGVYRRGGPRDNPVEADAVVKRILFHARNHPKLTLGVVAFSEAQAAAIEIALEGERKASPELDGYFSEDRLRGFFVKNLENVQGDERDIIIFSVGYGPDEAGRFTLQFGPLNRAGGWRRLNVAITRARRRVEVVSSVSSGDFVGDSGNVSVRHFKRYLDYCERGMPALALTLGEEQRDVESPFEEAVARTIQGWGYDVVPQVGCASYRIDMAVRNPTRPGSYAIGIECDGAMYHSSKVARDRDRLRQEVIQTLGWRLHRIWGTAWYHDRVREEALLKSAIEAAVEGKSSPVPRRESRVEAPPPLVEVEFSDTPDWISHYQVESPRPPRYDIEMHDPSAFPDLKRMVRQVVSTESPVSEEVTLKRVREAWGRGRAGSRIRDAFDDAVKALVREGAIVREATGFLWMKDKEYSVRVPVAGSPESQRRIQDVAPEERRLAMRWLAQDARSISRDELSLRIARIFGWNRRGSDIAPVLEEDIGDLVREGMLAELAGRLEYRGED